MNFVRPAIVSASLLALACGGLETGAAGGGLAEVNGGESEDELRGGPKRVFDCRGQDVEGTLGRFELTLTGTTKAKIIDISKRAAAPGTGTLNPDYRPTSASYQGASLFEGFADTRESMSASDFGSLSLIVSKALKDGEDNKRVWIRYNGGGSTTEGYTCKKKDAALAVDLGRAARVSCDLTPLICKDDDPPGSTCLSDLFIKQSDESASMRLTYLDHFGVHARERKENLDDAALTRTKKKVSGTWEGHKLELEYRAGVTYLGTLKIPGGESTKVHCSDLAMLD